MRIEDGQRRRSSREVEHAEAGGGMMQGQTYTTNTGRRVGIRLGLDDVWITAYLDRDQHKGGRVRCTQVPVAADPIEAQFELDKYAKLHGWIPAGMQEVES